MEDMPMWSSNIERQDDDSEGMLGLFGDQVLNFDNGETLLNLDSIEIKFVEHQHFEEVIPEILGPPARGDFVGDYGFRVIIKPEGRSTKCTYSERVKRVYIHQGVELPVEFSWDTSKSPNLPPKVVRATLQFAERIDAEQRPMRCRLHTSPLEALNKDMDESIIAHVLQSVLKDDHNIRYCGDPNNDRSWLSICAEFPVILAPGAEFFSHTYKFMCKTSCTSGINRRPIEVAFTLEDVCSTVLGRQTIGVRVCSCPKRDMAKDEQSIPSMVAHAVDVASVDHADTVSPKKPRVDTPTQPLQSANVDLTPYNINITVMGKQNYETVLRVAMALMRDDAHKLHPLHNQLPQSDLDKAICNIANMLHTSQWGL